MKIVGSLKIIGRNSLFALSSEVMSKALAFIFFAYMARSLDPVLFGRYNFALAFAAISIVFSDFGLKVLLTRDIAKHKNESNELFMNGMLLRFILSLLAFGLITLFAIFASKTYDTRLALILSGLTVIAIGISDSCRTVFQGFERFFVPSLLFVLQKLLFVLGGVTLIYLGYKIVPILTANLLFEILFAIVFLVLLRKLIFVPKFKVNWTFSRRMLSLAVPFALTGIFGVLYQKSDLPILGILKNDASVGLYSSAYKLYETLLIIPSVIGVATLPTLSRIFKESSDVHNHLTYQTIKLLSIVIAPITLLGLVYSSLILKLIYSKTVYLDASLSLKILMVAFSFISLNQIISVILFSVNQQRKVLYVYGINAAISIVLYVLLIERYNFNGASVTTLLSEIIALALFLAFSRSFVKFSSLITVIWKAFASATVMIVFLTIVGGKIPVLLALPLALSVYVIVLIVIGGIQAGELVKIIRIIPLGEGKSN